MSPSDLRDVETQLNTAIQGNRELGELNPRNPGLHNDLIQVGKKLVRRSLTWYTRPLQVFQAGIIEALEGMLSVRGATTRREDAAQQSAQQADVVRPSRAEVGIGSLGKETDESAARALPSLAAPRGNGLWRMSWLLSLIAR